jgi:hypothetical protein
MVFTFEHGKHQMTCFMKAALRRFASQDVGHGFMLLS